MFGNYIYQKSRIIQKKIYSSDYKHKYLLTMLVFNGRVISKSTIEITQK